MNEKNYHTDNKSFIVYKDWEEYTGMLDDEQAGKLFKALFVFAKSGEMPKLPGMTAMAFAMMKNCIERDGIAWEEMCEKNRKNAMKGGRPKKPTGFSCGLQKAEKPDKDTDSDNDNNTDTDSEIETDSETVTEKANELCEVRLSDDEKHILYSLADRQTIDRYILNILDWQKSSGKVNTKPYISIRKWLDEDGMIKSPQKPDYKYSSDKQIEEFERYADSIDFSTLST
ncbi:MAG: hypothetical protein J6O40_02205 [Ruminococcus sp.]|nr:hypothetical protein [Ruminococcus sp.]